MAYGLSANVEGQLFKITYDVQILVRHAKTWRSKRVEKKPDITVPITILTPNQNIMPASKIKMHQLQELIPTKYDKLDLYLTVEQEDAE